MASIEKQEYEAPAITYEADLEVRAGSPTGGSSSGSDEVGGNRRVPPNTDATEIERRIYREGQESIYDRDGKLKGSRPQR